MFFTNLFVKSTVGLWYSLVVVVEIEQGLLLVAAACHRLLLIAIAGGYASNVEHCMEGRATALYLLVEVGCESRLRGRQAMVVAL